MATGAGGVADLEADDLLGSITNTSRTVKGIPLASTLVGSSASSMSYFGRDLAVLVANDGEVDRGVAHLVDVLDPSVVRCNVVGRQSDDLDAALLEFGCLACNLTELGGANGRKVVRVREEDSQLSPRYSWKLSHRCTSTIPTCISKNHFMLVVFVVNANLLGGLGGKVGAMDPSRRPGILIASMGIDDRNKQSWQMLMVERQVCINLSASCRILATSTRAQESRHPRTRGTNPWLRPHCREGWRTKCSRSGNQQRQKRSPGSKTALEEMR